MLFLFWLEEPQRLGILKLTCSSDLKTWLSDLWFTIHVYCNQASLLVFVCFLNASFPSGSQNPIGKALIIVSKRSEQTQQSETALISRCGYLLPNPGHPFCSLLPPRSADCPHSCSALPRLGLRAKSLLPGAMPLWSISIKTISKVSHSQLWVGQAEEVLPMSASWVCSTQLISPWSFWS